MKISIDMTPQEASGFPRLLELDRSLDDLVNEALTVERNRQRLLAFQKEVFNGRDWSIETLSRHLTDDFVDYAAPPGARGGLEGLQERFEWWGTAFTAALEENELMVGQGDNIAVLYTLRAHHGGEFLGIPATHRDVAIPGIEFLKFRDGKIAAHWGIYDFMTTAREIGADMVFLPRSAPVGADEAREPWEAGAAEAAERELVGGD